MTIFDNIIYNENSFTELFKNFMRYKVFRDQFILLIDSLPNDITVDFEHFNTQKSSNDCRPDIRIISDEVDIFIEIKVWNTVLTYNQPVGYIRELEKSNKQNKSLVLIVPKHYKYLSEYESRKNDYPTSVDSKIITWDNIIKLIENKEMQIGNPMIFEFLQLLKEWFEPKKIIINSDFVTIMNNKLTPENIIKLVETIDQLNNEITKRGFITTKKKNFLEEYGFYIEDENFSLFIGEWFYYWQTEGKPLCISLQSQDNMILDKFNEISKVFSSESPTLLNESWLTFGIAVQPQFDINNLIDNLYKLISSIKSETGHNIGNTL